ncbi:MAG TPA: LruC domain-containing protein [Leptospiraceae bacterium]|nr:LruC domain-containing protein [Leptospiraceae bacterium]HRG76157.1 LruC domain-containing protein [Leptospiraceae bacterium]
MKFNIGLVIIILSLFSTQCSDKKKQLVPLQLQQQIVSDTVSSNGNASATNSPATSTGNSSTPTTTTPSASINSAPVTVSGDYITQTTATTIISVSVDATVVDDSDLPVKGAVVEIKDSKSDRLFLQVSDVSGFVRGSLSVNAVETSISVNVTFNGQAATPAIVVIKKGTNEVLIKLTKIKIGVTSSVITTVAAATPVVDADGDGVPDSLDAYPNDATRTAKVRFPTEGVNTIAYEDTFPSASDSDLNDLVIVYFIEEDQNAEGKVVEVRGNYQMMASGAGNKLSVYQRLPNTVNITYQSKVYDGSGVLQASAAVLKDKTQATSIDVYTPTVTDLEDGLRILGNTTTTMTQKNSMSGQTTYVNGFMAKTKIVFNTPVARSVIGLAPYDLYIRVESPGNLDTTTAYVNAGGGRPGCKATTTAGGFNVYEIHPVGFCKKADGSEVYKDSNNNFPFVVIVPGLWKWPLESKKIYQAGSTGYPRFANWMATNGTSDADWYNEPDAATSPNVYYSFVTGNKTALDAPNSQLLAFIGKVSLGQYQMALVTLLLTIGLFLAYKWKSQSRQA